MKEEKIYPPCEHMKPVLNEAADGKLRGPSKLYVFLHLLHCPGCRRFLRNLKELILNLRIKGTEENDADAIARLREVVRQTGGG
jgi:hypothetical protein